jgi:hypothetical protein
MPRSDNPNLQRWQNRDPLGEPGFETLHLVTQPLFIRKLRLNINDSEMQYFLAMAIQSGSVDVSSYLRNSHTFYAGNTISALAFLNILRNGQGTYAPNWPVELLEYPNLYEYVGNDPLNGIDPYGLYFGQGAVNWTYEHILKPIGVAIDAVFESPVAASECAANAANAIQQAQPSLNYYTNNAPDAPIPTHGF